MAAFLRVIVRPATLPGDCEAVTIIAGRRAVVLFDPRRTASAHRLRWNIAHELGHVVCGHTARGQVAEAEANWFAACLLMPGAWLLCDLGHANAPARASEHRLRAQYQVGRQSFHIRIRQVLPEGRRPTATG